MAVVKTPVIDPAGTEFGATTDGVATAGSTFYGECQVSSQGSFQRIMQITPSPVISSRTFYLDAPPGGETRVTGIASTVIRETSVPGRP